jgi:uncharacterized repeat protein (TIGR03803 family)
MKSTSIFRFVGALAYAALCLVSAANAATDKVLYSFKGGSNGDEPVAGLINVNGTLYGTAGGGSGCELTGCGIVYAVNPTSGAEKVLYAFKGGNDGAYPNAGLIDVGGTLYGTTSQGGGGGCNGGCGTVFSITPSGAENVIYAFNGGGDGESPYAGLIAVNGTLYGTTAYGGNTTACTGIPGSNIPAGCGVVFSIASNGTEKLLYAFNGGSDGANPYASLTAIDRTLYGTTVYGGNAAACPSSSSNPAGCGTVFSITLRGTENVLYAFIGGNDGAYPYAGLLAVDGTLYGTTVYGGNAIPCPYESSNPTGCGTVYSVTPAGTEEVLYAFMGGTDGASPYAGLIDVDYTLYGTTYQGGGGHCGGGCGTVFRFGLPDQSEKVTYAFKGNTDGVGPQASLVEVSGRLYGTTLWGGTGSCATNGWNGCGTVFSVKY